jgi:hypothetical protein
VSVYGNTGGDTRVEVPIRRTAVGVARQQERRLDVLPRGHARHRPRHRHEIGPVPCDEVPLVYEPILRAGVELAVHENETENATAVARHRPVEIAGGDLPLPNSGAGVTVRGGVGLAVPDEAIFVTGPHEAVRRIDALQGMLIRFAVANHLVRAALLNLSSKRKRKRDRILCVLGSAAGRSAQEV